jgi:hypothetical protein
VAGFAFFLAFGFFAAAGLMLGGLRAVLRRYRRSPVSVVPQSTAPGRSPRQAHNVGATTSIPQTNPQKHPQIVGEGIGIRKGAERCCGVRSRFAARAGYRSRAAGSPGREKYRPSRSNLGPCRLSLPPACPDRTGVAPAGREQANHRPVPPPRSSPFQPAPRV